VKTDRRDSVSLAGLHRAGELTPIWVPDAEHEAMRDQVRARATAVASVRRARQHLSSFLLRHGRYYSAGKAWTRTHRSWLAGVKFDHPAQQIVLQDMINAVSDAERRRDALGEQIRLLLPTWSMAPLVAALQALRGVALVNAATLVAEAGDLTRFATPRQLMAQLGLVPSERSSGASTRRGGITKTGNGAARRAMIEAAWTYRLPARIGRVPQQRQDALSKPVRDVAWKAQVRLCGRYRKLIGGGKPTPAVTTAIARELLGFAWAIARQVAGVEAAGEANQTTFETTAQGWRRGKDGESSSALRAGSNPTLATRPRQLRDEPWSCGTQSAHQRWIDRRHSEPRLLPWAVQRACQPDHRTKNAATTS
jgi:transposase